ncbi:hypothetical protein BpHYR1_027105 [Brachionus plicatilis]|uniref:Uncharacterized protein n=1 Tax=Brachionus plicatilis TaxID=10195 RepID=A0A3M7Q6L5_BRAPC|nr:hypothetical protein BpHYR1_027105 [Brachionus plicatilis]
MVVFIINVLIVKLNKNADNTLLNINLELFNGRFKMDKFIERSSILKLFSMLDKQYLRLNKNWLKILYEEDGIIYIRECYNASNIKIKRSNIKHCYKEIKVSFKLRENKINGFLHNNGIISLHGTEIKCERDSVHIKIDDPFKVYDQFLILKMFKSN